MMVSITHCWKKCLESARVIAGTLLASLLFFGTTLAGSIEPQQAALVTDERGKAISAEFAIRLGPRLEEAVTRGVPLNFRFEFTLVRKRWYWVDEHISGAVLDYRLGYQALTRQYRLSVGTLHQNFESLDEALNALRRVARLHVIGKERLIPGETYAAAVRLSLDHHQLPKPLQVDALADRDWRVEAKTLRWEFTHSADK
jgi:hypothetical protein